MAANSTSAMCSDQFQALAFRNRAAVTALVALYWVTAGTANAFNVLIMGKLSYHFPTWPNLTICFLSVADFVTVIAGLLPTVVATAWMEPLLCEYPKLCDFQGFFLTMTFLASFCMLMLISFDRFTAICCPFCYNKHIARNRPIACRSLFVAAGILFLLCSLAASITFLLGHRMVVHYPGWYCAFDWRGNDWGTYIPCSVHAGVSIMVVIVLGSFTFGITLAVVRMKRNAARLKTYGKVATRRVHGVESGASVPKTRKVASSRQRDLETVFARVAITTTTVHTLLGLPFIVRLVLTLFGVEFSEAVDLAFVAFLMLHAAVNPILYGAVRRTVRRTYWWGLKMAVGVVCCSEKCRPKESLSDILGITSPPTQRRRPSSDYVCRPVVITKPSRRLPHIRIHSNHHLQTMVRDRDSHGGTNAQPLPAAAECAHGADCHCNSILAANDSQNWNVDYNLRRYTLANLDPLAQPPPTVEAEEASCETHHPEGRLQSFQALQNSEEGEHAGTAAGLSRNSRLTPGTSRVIVWHHDGAVVSVGTVVSVGKWMDGPAAAAEGSAGDEGLPPS